jgi:hypothetical protein
LEDKWGSIFEYDMIRVLYKSMRNIYSPNNHTLWKRIHNVTKTQKISLAIVLLFMTLIVACAPVKMIEVHKDADYTEKVGKVMILAMAQEPYIRKQFEKVLANQLIARGIEVVLSHEVLPQSIKELDRKIVVAKVMELGVANVLVSRSISRQEVTNQQAGGLYFKETSLYPDGWSSYAVAASGQREVGYTTDYLTVESNLFVVGNKNPVWSNLAELKIEDSRQDAVNKFIPFLVEQLELSNLL